MSIKRSNLMTLFIIWKKPKVEERRESIRKAEVEAAAVVAAAKVGVKIRPYPQKKINIESEAALKNQVK